MESIFTRLHSYRPRENRNPEEDFFTELFVGVMERDINVLSHLLNKIANIDTNINSLKIDSQCSFIFDDELKINNRPDIVIEGEDFKQNKFTIFIESKIGSTEGDDQLPRYAKQLLTSYPTRNNFLFFITSSPENKNISEVLKGINPDKLPTFKQYQWYEIYDALSSFPDKNLLLRELLNFMEDKKMKIKLGLIELATTLNHKKNELIYSTILNEAWKKSKINDTFLKHKMNKSKWSSLQNNESQISLYSPSANKDNIMIYYGFWFNHENNYFNVFDKAFEGCSHQFPVLFVAVGTSAGDKKKANDALSNIKANKEFNALQKVGWKWRDDNINEWVLLAKSIDLNDISKHNNFADLFIVKFRDVLDEVNVALKDLF